VIYETPQAANRVVGPGAEELREPIVGMYIGIREFISELPRVLAGHGISSSVHGLRA